MQIVAWILFGIGALFIGINLLSPLGFLFERLMGTTRADQRNVSSLPFLGSTLLVVAAVLFWRSGRTGLMWLTIVMAFFDTGGLHVCIASIFWHEKVSPWLERRRLDRGE